MQQVLRRRDQVHLEQLSTQDSLQKKGASADGAAQSACNSPLLPPPPAAVANHRNSVGDKQKQRTEQQMEEVFKLIVQL